MAKRAGESPTLEEIEERLLPGILTRYPDFEEMTSDEQDSAYIDYLRGHESLQYSERTRKRLKQLAEFKKAGGKNLQQDQDKTAKRIVKTRKQYEKSSAQRVDIRGIDTKQDRVYKTWTIKRKGHKITVGRDAKGRFTNL